MHFLLIPLGSYGDVHPYLGLGTELARRGRSVTVFTNPHFQPLIERLGLPFIPLGTTEQFAETIENPDLWHPRRGFETIARFGMLAPMRETYEVIAERFADGQTVVVAPCMALGARIALEKLDVPLVTLALQPSVLFSAHQSPRLPPLLLGDRVPRWFKRWQFRMAGKMVIDPTLCPELNAFRAELGLSPVSRVFAEWWLSPQRVLGTFPDWYAPPQPDWPSQTSLTNFPLWDEQGTTEVPPEAVAFLDEGDPPIVFTAGSAMVHGREFFAAAADACRLINRRGILLTRYGDQIPSNLGEGVRHFDYIPFRQVLPRAAAIVHHGGIGTLSQGFAAGIPQLIMPMSHDQPDNAARLRRLGLGSSIARHKFTPRRVAAALEEILNSSTIAENCRNVAQRLRGVDGPALTADVIEQFAEEMVN